VTVEQVWSGWRSTTTLRSTQYAHYCLLPTCIGAYDRTERAAATVAVTTHSPSKPAAAQARPRPRRNARGTLLYPTLATYYGTPCVNKKGTGLGGRQRITGRASRRALFLCLFVCSFV
jgi:hypothetical protein